MALSHVCELKQMQCMPVAGLTGRPSPVNSLHTRLMPTKGAELSSMGHESPSHTPLASPSWTDSMSCSQRLVGMREAGRNNLFSTIPGSTSHSSKCLTTLPVSCTGMQGFILESQP